ncbi:hypothetical protein HHE02_12230 [Helicobacter heilmannii]|nr:hypothetical protein HHE014_15060 [Helicobacter heilmannii]CRF47922.1 hypothetical protein HHE02_12230 [Helicobacter heilmannii]CRF48789.1 hypothetical protein HHE03_03660 [Helicobacter heilmannii]CRF50409.1 hypothetical protein HHE06_02340 [Helicobacter heilmannii]
MFSLSGLQVLRWHNSYSGSPLKRGVFISVTAWPKEPLQ